MQKIYEVVIIIPEFPEKICSIELAPASSANSCPQEGIEAPALGNREVKAPICQSGVGCADRL